MYINMNSNASYNFKTPNLTADADKKIEVMFPANDAQTPDYAASVEVAVKAANTFVAPAELTGNLALSLDIDSEVTKGAMLVLQVTADDQGTKLVTLGTGLSGKTIVVPSEATVNVLFVYDGTNYVQVDTKKDYDVQSLTYAATKDVSINAQFTCLNFAQLTGAMTVNATIGAHVQPGAIVVMKLQSDGTARDTTPGTGFISPVVAGVISKTKYATFVYNGTALIPTGVAVQVD